MSSQTLEVVLCVFLFLICRQVQWQCCGCCCKSCSEATKGQCCVVLLPDSVRNYVSILYSICQYIIQYIIYNVLVDTIDICLVNLLPVILYHNIDVYILIGPNLSMMIGWLIKDIWSHLYLRKINGNSMFIDWLYIVQYTTFSLLGGGNNL